ncbi:S1 RNA-binding domain-containing protein [Clostridiaceae bacterium OttesenSCG-928-D20]|nr:S1 RNA-binding domain-containing protein [Clostridiaceae bacterium OttesenSCG-928-D20]
MLEVGAILEGKVSSIMKFGAFIALDGGKSGLVHISEVANTYVNDVSEHLTLGQLVKVRVMSISEDGKINLSIKKAEPPPERPQRAPQAERFSSPAPRQEVSPPSGDLCFEDKLKKFIQESETKNSGNRLFNPKKANKRRK